MLRKNTLNTEPPPKGLFALVEGLALPRNRGGALDVPAWLDAHAKGGNASALTHLGELHLGNAVTGAAQAEALRLLQAAGQKGYGPAQVRVGVLLALGITGSPEPDTALPWLEQAAAQGVIEAVTMLGLLYATGDGVSKDAHMAASLFQKASEGGETTAKRWLHNSVPAARSLISNVVLEMLRVLVRAMRELRDDSGDAELIAALVRISESGDAYASLMLGIIHTEGKLVAANRNMADRWYARATEQGNALAPLLQEPLTAVTEDIMKAPDAAIRVLTMLAQSGDPEISLALATMHGMREDREPDFAAAAKWLRVAAEQGHRQASYLLACALQNGEGVKQDETEAVRWFRVAAELGDADAQLLLAYALSKGRGVAADEAEAMRWFSSAAEHGNAGASYMLAMFLRQQGEYSAAAARMQVAAEAGDAHAQTMLGLWYGMGLGVDRDLDKAEQWVRVAKANDPEVVSEILAMMKGN